MYRSLKPLLDCKEDIFKTIWENTKDKYNRDASTSYYDCTNYYFEIEYDDKDKVDDEGKIVKKGLRKRGPEKNHRPDPIVEMGLLLDKQGFPISYNLFSGSTSEKETLVPEIKKIKHGKKYTFKELRSKKEREFRNKEEIKINNYLKEENIPLGSDYEKVIKDNLDNLTNNKLDKYIWTNYLRFYKNQKNHIVRKIDKFNFLFLLIHVIILILSFVR